MTRETKIGLVVAGSFLCLVGIVVASKWNRGESPGEHEEQSPNPVAAAKPVANAGKGEAKKDAATAVNQTESGVVPVSSPNPENASPQTQGPIVPPPGGFDLREPNRIALTQTAPPIGNDDPVTKNLLRITQNTTNTPPNPEAAPKPTVADLQPMFPPPIAIDPKPAPLKTEDDKQSPAPATNGPPPLQPAPVVPNKNDPPGKPALEAVKPAPVVPMQDLLLGPVLKPDAQKPLPPVATPDPSKNDLPPAAKDPPMVGFPKDIAKPGFAPTPDPATPNVQKPAVIPPLDGNSGGQHLVTPPIIVGAPKTLPAVKDWTTDTYLAGQGETNFAILSLKMYGTEKYADALLAYNRAHSAGVRNGSALQYNPPLLNPGQQVLKPPIHILESDYRAMIREPGAAKVPTIPSGTAPVKLATPAPLQTPSIAANVSTPPAVASGRVYTVQSPGGESILDIAERALGSNREWHRIAALNPQYQPQFRIPAGTQLKLP